MKISSKINFSKIIMEVLSQAQNMPKLELLERGCF